MGAATASTADFLFAQILGVTGIRTHVLTLFPSATGDGISPRTQQF
jgi:hypothetical protein